MSEFINNSEYRQKKLKELIRSLHEGKTVDEVKAEFQKEFENVSTTEISQIEQALVKEGLPIEEVQRLCDVHASVFNGSIADIHVKKDYSHMDGHPVNVFMEENKAIEKLITEEIRPQANAYTEHPNPNSHLMLRISMEQLWEIHNHYARKEYLFFPYLEKYDITAPPKVMWGVDDEIRADIKDTLDYLKFAEPNPDAVKEKVDNVTKIILDMISKENNILIPLLTETLTFYEWIKIDEASPEFGHCLVKPKQSWKVESKEPAMQKEEIKPNDNTVIFDAGFLTPNEINAIFNTLPIDITFVDAQNKVKYFSQNTDRIFQRPTTVIGRAVSLCHPPKSVGIVEKIIDSFKNGEKDHEDFWIRKGNLFIYIRYYAVRDKERNFLGTLEITQNIKPITELQGEKRLMDE
jgi:DUF438 domain-containing protein